MKNVPLEHLREMLVEGFIDKNYFSHTVEAFLDIISDRIAETFDKNAEKLANARTVAKIEARTREIAEESVACINGFLEEISSGMPVQPKAALSGLIVNNALNKNRRLTSATFVDRLTTFVDNIDNAGKLGMVYFVAAKNTDTDTTHWVVKFTIVVLGMPVL